MSNFRVGQKVVCVDDKWHDAHFLQHACPLELGRVYTIVDVIKSMKGIYRGVIGGRKVLLAETENPYGASIGFDQGRFRPTANRKTDISVFKAMLNPQKTEVTA